MHSEDLTKQELLAGIDDFVMSKVQAVRHEFNSTFAMSLGGAEALAVIIDKFRQLESPELVSSSRKFFPEDLIDNADLTTVKQSIARITELLNSSRK